MRPNKISWAHWALFAGFLHFLLTASIGLARHWGYQTSIHDLGVFDQAIWGTLNGAPFLNTSSDFGAPINWLGFHFNPVLFIFAPCYLIYPAAEWLILVQAAAISLTAWPLYLLAKRVLQSERVAFLWSAIFLMSPFVLNAAVWDFHPVALAAPFMAFAVLAIEKRQAWLFGLACLFLLSVQEQFGITVAGFGILWWLRNRSWTLALAATFIGIAYTILVFGVIMPALSPTGNHVMMSSDLGQLSRYGWLGGSAGETIRNAFSHPLLISRTVFVDGGGASYLAVLLVPLLATPLAGIEFLLPALADLFANLLSANPMPRSAFSYHSISIMPVLVAAGIYGSSRIAFRWRRYAPVELAKLALWGTLLLSYFTAPFSLPYAYNYWRQGVWAFKPEQELSQIRKLLPPEAAVSAQANVAAHFTQRHRVYPFPAKEGDADFILLRLDSPTRNLQGQNPGRIGSLAYHLAMPPRQYLNAVEQLLADGRYGVGWWAPPWLVFSKGEMTPAETEHAVRQHLAGLEREWAITDGHSPQASPGVANP